MDHVIQCTENIKTGELLQIFIIEELRSCGLFLGGFLCRSRAAALTGRMLFRLRNAADQPEYIVGTLDLILQIRKGGIGGRCIGLRREACKTGVELFRIVYLCDDEHDGLHRYRDRFYDKRHIFRLEAKVFSCLLHHILKQRLGFIRTVSKFAELDLAAGQVFLGQRAANLPVIDFFNFHVITSLLLGNPLPYQYTHISFDL